MKKIIILLSLISSLFADAKVYLGSSYGVFEEKFTNDIEAESSTDIAKIKAGYGVREAYAVEISFEYIKNKTKIFSSDAQTALDGDKYGINVDLIKAFDYDVYVLPFIKAGFGSGYFNINRKLQNRLFYGSFNLATGIFIPINETFDFELGYEYKHTSYESVDTIVEKIKYESDTNIVYFGFNVRF
ncbi:MAG: outer membrane beta-barrel protein [Campylobacterota bacterium]|nr:outer membrane beta-barrel protein [Campylobacterota bacterium]